MSKKYFKFDDYLECNILIEENPKFDCYVEGYWDLHFCSQNVHQQG